MANPSKVQSMPASPAADFLRGSLLACREFAGWIATIHHQPCHVVYTDYRPVPLQVGPLNHSHTSQLLSPVTPLRQCKLLPAGTHAFVPHWCVQHYIFPSSGDGLYLVVDEKAQFRESNFQKAMAVLQVRVPSNHNITT